MEKMSDNTKWADAVLTQLVGGVLCIVKCRLISINFWSVILNSLLLFQDKYEIRIQKFIDWKMIWKCVKLIETVSNDMKLLDDLKLFKWLETLLDDLKLCEMTWKYVKWLENMSNDLKLCQMTWNLVRRPKTVTNDLKLCWMT